VSIPELKNYVNSYAKIILKSGKKFKGLIVEDEENSITLKVKTQGGSIEMQMNYEKIKKALIYK
jgi:ribosome maturation factor RimP